VLTRCTFPFAVSVCLRCLAAHPFEPDACGGATAGAVKLTSQRSEQALTGVVQLQRLRGSPCSATPSFVHVSDIVSGRSVSSNGMGDLPLSADASHSFATAGSPVWRRRSRSCFRQETRHADSGSGETSFGLDLGAGVFAKPATPPSADASRSISGLSAQSSPQRAPRDVARGEASYDVAPSWTTSVSLGADVGQSDSTQALSRTLGAGITHALAGRSPHRGRRRGALGGVAQVGAVDRHRQSVAGTSPVSPGVAVRRLNRPLWAV